MRRKKEDEPQGRYIISWSSISGDGWRVKHRMWRDDEVPDGFWHVEIRLTDNPFLGGGHEVYPRQFFGKVWIAQRFEFKRAFTWKAIGEAVRQLEMKEQKEQWNHKK